MSELTERVEEIAAAMQRSYEADIDLLTRRDKAHVKRIAELEAQLARLATDRAMLEAELAQAGQWVPVESIMSADKPEHLYTEECGFSLCDDDGAYQMEFRYDDGNKYSLCRWQAQQWLATIDELEAQLADANKSLQAISDFQDMMFGGDANDDWQFAHAPAPEPEPPVPPDDWDEDNDDDKPHYDTPGGW